MAHPRFHASTPRTRWRSALGVAAISALLAMPATAQTRIAIMGDTIQVGWLLTNSTQLAAYQLGVMTNAMVHNFSSPGSRITDHGFFAGMKHDGPTMSLLSGFFGFGNELPGQGTPKGGIIITLGTHDFDTSKTLADFEQSYGMLLDFLGTPTNFWKPPKVVCMTPIWRENENTPNALGLVLENYRQRIRTVCAAHGRPVMEGLLAVPNARVWYADAPGFPAMHPNAFGHAIMAIFWRDQLRRPDIGWLPPA